MKHTGLGLIALFIVINLGAQRPGGGGRAEGSMPPAIGIVSGKVLEEGSNLPMEYANVVIYSLRDSSIVAGTVTGPDGSFRVDQVRAGRMYGIANFIGYEKTHIPEFAVNPRNPEVDLGIVYLLPAATNLQGVEVVADKTHVEYKIDKKIINVSQDIMAQGGSAVAVLENTPSVQVDIEGNVSLRGTSNFEVLVDGRPSVLKGSDALQQIPASNIEHIEVITNPSARYDPDGVGGIINVVLKKQKSPGTNGVINTSIATRNKYKLDALLNHKTRHVNVFGGVDFNYREFNMQGVTNAESYLDDSTFYRDSDREGQIVRNGYGLKAGVDYFITDRSTLTLMGHYGGYGFGRDFLGTNTNYTSPVSETTYTRTNSESERSGDFLNLNLNYILSFDKKGHKLELLSYYANRSGDDWEEQQDYETDSEWNNLDATPGSIRTTEDETDRDIRLKADYTKPLGADGRLEAGYQSRLAYENEQFTFEDYDYIVNDWVVNDLYTSEVDFKRNIHALYTTYSNVWGNWGYQLGLRGEWTDREIQNVNSLESYAIDRIDLFPSVHLSKQFPGDNQALASYSRRIDRPRGRQLDPFVNYMDEYNVRIGNPGLEPEYIDSYELGYQKRFSGSFLSFETYYRITKNKITRIKTLQDDGVFVHTYENLNKDYALGMEVMLNSDITSWFNFNGSVNVYDYRLEGEVEGEDVSSGSTNWDARLNLTFKMKNDFRGQVTSFYRGPSVTAQGRREGNATVNLALRKDFFNKRFTTTLAVRDVFATGRREMTTEGTDFYTYDNYRRESPILTLNLSYVINNYNRKGEGSRDGMMGEEEMDIGM